jgi:enamine deaminase RidA (YjgF/YER057c/UK114 family)
MSITRHESGPILSLAVENGSTVYLAGIVPKNLKNDIKGQTQEVLAEIDRLLAK